MSEQSFPNVIVFGETGAGKSSVINMILGSDKAKVGNSLLGETFRSTVYPIEIGGKIYNLHDTVGFGEHSGGAVDSAKAVRNLHRLVTNLSNSGGVNLLVFVMRRGRLTETIHKNYTLFHHGFCDSKVPIVIVVTGCEDVEPTMDTWWTKNERWFTQAGMLFNGHACVCAFRGRKTTSGDYRNEVLFQESVGVVKKVIVQFCVLNGWEKPSILWLRQVFGSIVGLFPASKAPTVYAKLFNRLTNVFSSSEAEQIINTVLRSNQPISNVVLFGGTGTGKSSVINMILGTDKAKVDNGLLGETSRSATYPVEINGKTYTLHDTAGLGGFSDSTVNDAQAVRNIYRLVADLSNTGGINLLAFVMKHGQKPTETMRKHYHLLHHGFCDSKVPIVIVVTGCENVTPNMDAWWTKNEWWLTKDGLFFDGHGCVCAVKGPRKRNGRYRNENRFEESATTAKQLIFQHCMLDGWKKPPIGFLKRFIGSMIDLFRSSRIPSVHTDLHDRLTSVFSRLEAEQIIGEIAQKS